MYNLQISAIFYWPRYSFADQATLFKMADGRYYGILRANNIVNGGSIC